MNGEVIVVDDIATAFVEQVVADYEARSGPRFAIALSGGSGATNCYPHLASAARDVIDWANVDLFWSDERCVSFNDERSNARAAQQLLIDRVGTKPVVHRMDCAQGPEAYELLLRDYGTLDVIHLGIGPDGHTASLFPKSPALKINDRLVVFNQDPDGLNAMRRMTMTFGAISQAAHVIVTVSGKAKASIVRRMKNGDDLPAQRLENKNLVWLIDHAAAGDTFSSL